MKPKIANQVACWGGHILHPILATLDPLFSASGYGNIEFSGDKTYSSASWRKNLFDGYQSAFVLTSQRLRDRIFGVLDLDANLQVYSSAQMKYEKDLGLCDCESSIMLRENVGDIVASIGFNWVTQRWQPKIPKAYLLWHKLKLIDAESSARAIFDLFESHGVPFFNYIGTPEALANAIVRPETVPGYDLRAGSIMSVSRFEYATVILNSHGQKQNALKMLDDYQKNNEARDFSDSRTPVHFCKERKLREWVIASA